MFESIFKKIFFLIWIIPVSISLLGVSPLIITIFINMSVIVYSIPFVFKKERFQFYDKLYLFYFLAVLLSMINPGSLTPFEGYAYSLAILAFPAFFINYLDSNENIEDNLRKILEILLYALTLKIIYASIIVGTSELSSRFVKHSEFSPSIIGRDAGIVFIISILSYLNKKKIVFLLTMFVSITFLILSFSKSGILSIVFVLLVIFIVNILFGNKNSLKIAIVSIVFVMIVLVFLYPFLEEQWLVFTVTNPDLLTFTGRVFIWDKIIELSKNAFWLGYGYYAAKIMLTYNFVWEGVKVEQAHNFFFHALLNTGIIGAVMLVSVVFKSNYCLLKLFFLKYKSHKIIDYNTLTLVSIILFLIPRSFTEASFAQEGNLDLAIIALGLSYYQLVKNKTLKNYK